MECEGCGFPVANNEVIGVEVRGIYDGVLYWQCPGCGYAWPREFASRHHDALSAEYARKQNEYRARRA